MQQDSDSVQDLEGNVIPGVAVRVTVKSTGALAQLWADDEASPLGNPVYTDSNGRFTYKAANGTYITTIEAGGRVFKGEEVTLYDPEDDVSRVVNLLDYGSPGSADNTAALQAAINAVQALGGGDILVQGAWRFTTLTTNATVNFIGVGQSRSVMVHTPTSPDSDGLVYSPTGSFRRPVIRNLSFLCSGEGRYGIATPVNAAQFNGAFAIDFDRVSIRRETGPDIGWAAAVRLGDMVQGSFTKSEIRGGFQAANDPSTQKDTVGVLMEAAAANIAVEFNGLQIVGCKTGIRLGENVEGYFGSSIEIVSCLDGIVSELANSKPGGFIANVHLNVARNPIRFSKRRDFTIGNLQLYRGSGYFNGAAEWNGLSLDGCSRWAIGNIDVRAVPGYTSDSNTCTLTNCTEFTIGNCQHGETTGIDNAFVFIGCAIFTVGHQTFAAGMASWYKLTGCSKGVIASHMSGDSSVPSNAYVLDATTNKRDIKIDRTGGDRIGYDEVSYAAAATRTIGFYEGPTVRTFNLNAGTAAYTVDIVLARANCLAGTLATFRVVLAASTNPTIRFCDDTNATVRHSIVGTAAIQRFEVTLVYNGAGWVTNKVISLVA
jgi:hypothetical protein